MIKLYNGDCLDVMDDIPDRSIDAVICDLPYGVTHNKDDVVIPFDPLWRQYKRVIKKNGAIVLFAQGLFYVDLVNSNRKWFRYDIVWDKVLISGFLNAKRRPLRAHESIAVFYMKQPTYNPQMTIGKPLHSKGKNPKAGQIAVQKNYGKHYVAEDYRKGSTEKYPKSIVSFKKPHPSTALHPTEKSVELMKWLVRTYTNEGDTVLDNAMGVGTTGIACKELGRNFIGIEIDKTYFDIANERLYK